VASSGELPLALHELTFRQTEHRHFLKYREYFFKSLHLIVAQIVHLSRAKNGVSCFQVSHCGAWRVD